MKMPRPTRKIAGTTRIPAQLFLLLALIVLPTLTYTGYELYRLDEAEEQITALYERQLDAILFSINQYAWDVSGSWLATLRTGLRDGVSGEGVSGASLPDQLAGQSSLRFAAALDGDLRPLRILPGMSGAVPPGDLEQLADSLRSHRSGLQRLQRFRRSGYHKIETLLMPKTNATPQLALVSAGDSGSPGDAAAEQVRFHLVCIDAEDFIRDILGPKFRDLAGEQRFVITCTERRSGRVVIGSGERDDPGRTTGTTEHPNAGRNADTLVDRGKNVDRGKSMDGDTMPAERALWLFPDYTVGIRLEGASIEELTRSRSRTSIILFSAVGVLLLAGAWLLYRSFRRELQLADMKTDFVSNVSHELKTPLALIRMYAETLEMGRIADVNTRQEYLSIIVKETERLTRLINNILAFSRIESGRKEYRKAPMDLNRIVANITDVYRFHLEQKGFRVHVETLDSLPVLEGDEEAVAEAVLNLLDNAMKYSDKHREITVRTGGAQDEAWVEVEDRGIGIPAELQHRIYEKFFRVSEGLVHTAKGSGLGLTLVRHIMDGHRGRVELRSAVGKGSTFRLVFPVSPLSPVSPPTSGARHGTYPGD